MKVLLFRLHSVSHPLIGVVVAAGLVLLKDVGPLPVQGFPQMFQQHLKGLVRRLLQQRGAKPRVDDGLQILNASHIALLPMGHRARKALSGQRKSPRMVHHMPTLRFLLATPLLKSENLRHITICAHERQ